MSATPRQPRRRRTLAAVLALLLAAAAGLVVSMRAAEAAGVGLAPTALVAVDGTAVVESYRYNGADTYQNLDAYYDSSWVGGAGRPAVIVIHGGSWANATKANSTPVSKKFFAEGFAVFNMNYRLTAPTGSHAGTPWPGQRTDVSLAIQWVKANAKKFGVNPNRIALYGFSSGGHMAITSSSYYRNVRAAVSVSGVLQPHRVMDVAVNGSSGGDVRGTGVVVLSQWAALAVQCPYYPTWSECNSRWNSFKPETYFSSAAPPFYAMMGDKDTVVPPSTLGAIDYWATKKGQKHVTVMVPGAAHDERMLTNDPARWAAMITWLRSKTA
jgi:acetyl esterase/lipase